MGLASVHTRGLEGTSPAIRSCRDSLQPAIELARPPRTDMRPSSQVAAAAMRSAKLACAAVPMTGTSGMGTER